MAVGLSQYNVAMFHVINNDSLTPFYNYVIKKKK